VSTFDYEDKKARNRIAGLTEDGRSVAVLARRENNRLGLYPISLTDGRWGPALFFNPDQDIVDVIRDERSFRVIGVTYDENNPNSFYLASEHQRLQKQVEDLYPGRTAFIVSTASDRSKSLVLTSGPKNPPALQFVDLQAGRIDTIAESYPQLRDTPLAEV